MEESEVEAIVAQAIDSLDSRYTLCYVHYDDELQDGQVAEFLAADDSMEVVNSVEESWIEQRFEAAWDIAADALKDAHAVISEEEDTEGWFNDFRAEHPDAVDEVRFAVEERDDSDIWGQLVRLTPDVLVRVSLGEDAYFDDTGDDPDETLRAMAEVAGIDYELNRDALWSILANGWAGHLYVMWAANVRDMTDGYRRPSRVTLTNPSLALLNVASGSGWEETIKGTITLDVSGDTPILVDSQNGYGWDKTCGGVSVRAYEPDSVVYEFVD